MNIPQKAVFIDIDGTLAKDNHPASDEDIQTIHRIQQQGHLVFVCTGRASGYIYPDILGIGFNGIVAGAGAHILLGDRLLYRRMIAPDVLQFVIDYFLSTKQICVLEGEQGMYLINDGLYTDMPWPRIKTSTDFNDHFAGHAITKLTIWDKLSEEALRLFSPHFTIIQHEIYVEAMPLGCCKSDGIRRILEATDIDPRNSIAIGDSFNDIDMLKYAGIGVAMGNAPDAVKAAANMVTDTCEHSGVSKVLKKLLLNDH
jgi:Cof subfamily protein (haloacid dehalogenase superfamily)